MGKTNISIDQEKIIADNFSFDELIKENHQMLSFTSNLSKMEPEVIKKAMDQTPEIAKTSRKAIGSMREVTITGLQENAASTNRVFDIIDKNADTIRNCMMNGNMSEEGQEKMADKLCEINRMAVSISEIDKGFIDKETAKVIWGSVAAVSIPALILSVGFTLVFKTPVYIK